MNAILTDKSQEVRYTSFATTFLMYYPRIYKLQQRVPAFNNNEIGDSVLISKPLAEKISSTVPSLLINHGLIGFLT